MPPKNPTEASTLYGKVKGILQNAGIENCGFEARQILASKPGFETETALRRALGEPLQYLLGEWEFYGLPFKVGAGVLIPRPETETLVDAVLEHFGAASENLEIIDLFSGSGCIAVALCKYLPRACVRAVELYDEALRYLTENITLNGVRADVIKGDAADKEFAGGFPAASFDCVTANPPYLTKSDMGELQKEVTFEPPAALDGGEDGLLYYHAIAALWHRALKRGGLLALEIDGCRAKAVSDILLSSGGFEDIRVTKDLGGDDRVVTALKQ
jgi:release factor glutamine methyltransferase